MMSLTCVETPSGYLPSYLWYSYNLVNSQSEALTCRQWSPGKGSKQCQAWGILPSRQVSVLFLHVLQFGILLSCLEQRVFGGFLSGGTLGLVTNSGFIHSIFTGRLLRLPLKIVKVCNLSLF